MAKPPLPTLDAATQECNELLHAYRELRDRDAPLAEFEALEAKVKSARMRAKKRGAEPGFGTLWHQLTDVSEYLKRFKPRAPLPPASADELLAEVASIRAALAAPRSPAQHRALTARAKSVHARIEDARARTPETDADHDAYVDVEEQLWDLGFPID